jgi:hypothetical protein
MMIDLVTTLLDVLACLLVAAGIVAIAAALVPGLLGIGIGLLVAAGPVFGLSLWAAR